MVISFFGHANFSCNEQFFNNVVTELKEIIGDRQVEFFVGYYGNFERFGVSCAKEIKKYNLNAKITLVTPYLKNDLQIEDYIDEVVYPEIESVPQKFAIIKRNEWVIDRSDLIIFYMQFTSKKTYDFYLYAKKKNKNIINLALLPKV